MSNNSTTVDPDEINSTFQRVENPDMVQWEGTHTYGNYSVTREVRLATYTNEIDQVVMYEHDGEELNRSRATWDISEREDADEFTPKPERYVVDHSGELPADFAESAHFADPQVEIEIAIEEHEG